MNKLLKIILPALFFSLAASYAFCGCDVEFKKKCLATKWIAYAPTNFDPSRFQYPSEETIRKDLELLFAYGFEGVVTYGGQDSLSQIPRIAREIGFSAVIMGVWDIEGREELMNATLANEYVDGYCLGNEGLNTRYDLDTLKNSIDNLKQATGKPVTTTEQISDYSNKDVFNLGDWIFPNIHPFLYKVRDPKKAAQWIDKHYRLLTKHCPEDRFVLFKEVGFPTQGAPKANQKRQLEFFVQFVKKNIPFVYFEAFDQQWKVDNSLEPHWGLFTASRKPKRYITAVSNGKYRLR